MPPPANPKQTTILLHPASYDPHGAFEDTLTHWTLLNVHTSGAAGWKQISDFAAALYAPFQLPAGAVVIEVKLPVKPKQPRALGRTIAMELYANTHNGLQFQGVKVGETTDDGSDEFAQVLTIGPFEFTVQPNTLFTLAIYGSQSEDEIYAAEVTYRAK
jgi:hypothetical protein